MLPIEIIEMVFQNLPISEVFTSVYSTCDHWRRIIRSARLKFNDDALTNYTIEICQSNPGILPVILKYNPPYSRAMLANICKTGNEDDVLLIGRHYDLSISDVVPIVLASGNLKIIIWLKNLFRSAICKQDVLNALPSLCSHGHLHALEWLVTHFGITSDEMLSKNHKGITPFDLACHNGHLDTAKWIAEKFNMETFYLSHETNYDWRNLRKRGHDQVADWINSYFHLNY